MAESYPIPTRLNFFIIGVCTLLFFALLYWGSHITVFAYKIGLGFAFGVIMIPVYSLIHESSHHTLHPDPRMNLMLGRWLCCLFAMPFTFYRHCHLKHHKKNRTDEEMWDLYYEHQNRWLRYGNLYLMMLGFGYLALWLSVLLFAFAPRLINSFLFKKHTEIHGFLEGFTDPHKIKVAQLESWGVILFQIFCWWFMHWDFSTWLMFYLIHGFIWSSQNYVNHAFSPRDILNGAHNLNVPSWLYLIYLNFNVHLAHHQNPKVPWIHLPKYIESGKERFSFFRNYLRLWKGPRPTHESSPK